MFNKHATNLNCGKLLRVLTTTYFVETHNNTQGNDLGHSNNVKNWMIRSQDLKIEKEGLGHIYKITSPIGKLYIGFTTNYNKRIFDQKFIRN